MMKQGLFRLEKLTSVILFTFVLVALGADFLANECPIFFQNEKQTRWPIFSNPDSTDIDWKKTDSRVIFTPIPFSASGTNLSSRLLPPLSKEMINGRSFRHWLGTDRLGRDIAAGMIHGCRQSLWVGLLAMIIASFAGVCIGALAGWFGNRQLRRPTWMLILFGLGVIYLSYLMYYELLPLVYGSLLALSGAAVLFFLTSGQGKDPVIPIDAMMMRTVEILGALPTLLLLMVLSTLVSTPSLAFLALIIGMLRWPRFALFVRSEVQKIKARNDILAARISGLSDRTIMSKLVLPEAMTSVAVLFAFGVSSTIILESTLSFLGIGVPIDVVTWGSILGQARDNISAWWLAIFPGLAIFILIMSLNFLGEKLRIRLSPHN